MDNVNHEERKVRTCLFCHRYFEPEGKINILCPRCSPIGKTIGAVFIAALGVGPVLKEKHHSKTSNANQNTPNECDDDQIDLDEES